MAERRRPLENDDGQGSLFGGEAFGPARPWVAPSEPAQARSVDAPEASAAATPESPASAAASGTPASEAPAAGFDTPSSARHVPPAGFGTPTEVPAHDELVAGEELSALEQATVPAADPRSPRNPRAPLAGPTLDDVMSRVWEGLATGLPAACPVCQGEVVSSLHGPAHGRCTSCGTTIE